MIGGGGLPLPPPPAPGGGGAGEKPLGAKTDLLESAVADADNGAVTNARKMEALAALVDLVPSLLRDEIMKQQQRVEGLCERLMAQNATEPMRRLVVSVLDLFNKCGDGNSLSNLTDRLLKLAQDQNKKVATNTKVAALDVVGQLMALHGRALEHHSHEVFVVVAKHMKLSEANVRCSAFQCLCKTMAVAGMKKEGTAGNIWKLIQKMLPDKATTVRTASANALAALVVASPDCTAANGDAMAVSCLKVLTAEDQPSQANPWASSESRFAFAVALAHVLVAMADPVALANMDKKKRPVVVDFATAVGFIEQAATKGPSAGPALVGFRAALCLSAVRVAEIWGVCDNTSIMLLLRVLLSLLDLSTSAKTRGSSIAEDDSLPQISRYVVAALRRILLLAGSETCLLQVIELGLVPLAGAISNEASRSTDARMAAVLEALCSACVTAGDAFRSIETKASKPLLHLVGNHPNPIVQLHAAYSLRVLTHSSPPQLFQLMSVLLNLVTVQNAELLGASSRPRRASGSTSGAVADTPVQTSEPLVRGLFGHCVALAALVAELFHSDLGVPHDVTSAVLNTARALLQAYPNASVSAQRRSCSFLLLEGLMCLGADWVGQRLTTLFGLWKAALGKKPVDRAKVLYQQHIAASSPVEGGMDGGASGCRDELVSLLCALRSLYAFTLHSRETLLTSLPHLHKILVVFLTNISQLLVALPHPTSANFRAKYRTEAPSSGQAWPLITFSTHCGIPEILLMMRSTMYHTFAAMLPTQYSTRFVPLLNMLADDVTRAVPAEFPVGEFLVHLLPPRDVVLDLVDPYTETSKDGAATTRLSVATLLSAAPFDKGLEELSTISPKDHFSEAAAASFFTGVPREGPNGTEGFLMPWDAWYDPARPLVAQCTSPEWDWRCGALSLLAIIMNSTEVSEAPRSQVLLHLLKRRDSAEDSAGGQQGGELGIVPGLAVLMYLREHVKTLGRKCAPPAGAMEQILNLSLEGTKDERPAVRRLHVEILALLLYIHQSLPDSPVSPTILSYVSNETSSDSAIERSSVAHLCGVALRTHAWGEGMAAQAANQGCPYLASVVPVLLRLAKETSQPVRLWMLHAFHLSIQAVGGGFAPHLKDALRLGTAHLLADFFESPLVLWVIAALAQSAASTVLSVVKGSDVNLREENVTRILSIWNELKRARFEEPTGGFAFATVRTEVLCISTAHEVVRLAPIALNQLRDVFDVVSAKLAPRDSGGSWSCAVRTAAAQCIRDFVVPGLSLGHDSTGMQELGQLFLLLDAAQGPEARALQELIQALIRQRGMLQLPMWLQTLKEMILALPPKHAGAAGKEGAALASGSKEEEAARRREEEEDARRAAQDEHDDGASMAQPSPADAVENRHRVLRSATKVFAVSCVHLLVQQADPDDASHFQAEAHAAAVASGETTTWRSEERLVHHLETLVALASHASSSDESSLAEAGLRLMLLIVRRFRHTHDEQGRLDEGECPLLLVQFEAQETTCIRHNLRPQANPGVVCLALELLRDVIAARACNSPQRLIALLMQPLSAATFEPDPQFCESTSTRRFLYRLLCACELLDTELEEQARQAVCTHLRDLARWIELSLRDASALLAGLPLQSIKTYQPACFSLTDYKAVQSSFRQALPTILRGLCALCSDMRASPSPFQQSMDVVPLALGLASLLLGDSRGACTDTEARVCVRAIRQVLSATASGGKEGSSSGGTVISVGYFLDLMGCIWQNIFRIPARCVSLLPDLLELVHMVSGAIRQQRQKLTKVSAPQEESGSCKALEAVWLDGLCNDSCEEHQQSKTVISAYCFHCIAAALRSPAVTSDVVHVSKALEVYVWWLEDVLPKSLVSMSNPAESTFDGDPDGELLSADTDAENLANMKGGSPKSTCCWLWLLFLSPFPLDLVQAHPAITLKYWKLVCNVLSAPQGVEEHPAEYADKQLLHLGLVINRLSKPLQEALAIDDRSLGDAHERGIVYLFALIVPTLSALGSVLQGRSQLDRKMDEGACRIAWLSMARVKEVFTSALGHKSSKVVQTAVSSMQNLLQNRSCTVLGPVVVPCLLLALVSPAPSIPDGTLETAWTVISAMVAGQQACESRELVGATTQMILSVVICIASHNKQQLSENAGDSNGLAHTAAMAQCLVQLARVDQSGLKCLVSAMPAEAQQTIQQLLREHMSAASRGSCDATEAGGSPMAAASAKKIELKMKF